MKNLSIIFLFSFISAQVSFTGNTETRIGESRNGFYYNETLINTHLQYGNFVNWLQFEFSDPPELGRSLNGLRKLRLEYNRGDLTINLGDLYEIWGRGLILNSIDDLISLGNHNLESHTACSRIIYEIEKSNINIS